MNLTRLLTSFASVRYHVHSNCIVMIPVPHFWQELSDLVVHILDELESHYPELKSALFYVSCNYM